MNESVTKYCEICQIKVEEDGKFHLLNNECKSKLLDWLPKIDLRLAQNPVVCDQCFTQITEGKPLHHLFNIVFVKDNTICVKEEPGVEKIKQEFNVGLIKEEVCESKDNFFVYVDKKASTEMYYCHDCGCCTDTKQKLIQHIYKQHRKRDPMQESTIEKNKKFTLRNSDKPYQCDKCDYRYAYTCRLKMHILSKHTDEKPYQCDKCHYKSARRDCLKMHKLSHTGEYPFQCDKCDYKSGRRDYFQIHISSHNGEYPFQCDKCDYQCGRKNRLKSHMLYKHTVEKPYQCDKCDYKSVHRDSLKMHILSHHTDEKPYQCDKCDYKSARKGCLMMHKFSHTKEKPYRCTQCNYTTVSAAQLKTHVYHHTGEKPFQCNKCDFKTAIKYSLKKHILSH